MAETPPPDARWLRHALIRSQQDLNGARERAARYANEALAWQQRAAACWVERAAQRERIAELEAELARERRELADCTRDGQRLSQLLAEEQDTTEALEAKVAEREAALRALVDAPPVIDVPNDALPDGPRCIYCGGSDWDQEQRDVTHTPDCPWLTARALLKRESNA